MDDEFLYPDKLDLAVEVVSDGSEVLPGFVCIVGDFFLDQGAESLTQDSSRARAGPSIVLSGCVSSHPIQSERAALSGNPIFNYPHFSQILLFSASCVSETRESYGLEKSAIFWLRIGKTMAAE
jgi:hypothetical protein